MRSRAAQRAMPRVTARVARRAAGVLGTALIAAALAACGGGPRIVDSAYIDDMPACLTYPKEMLGKTFWALDRDDYEELENTHPDPRDPMAPQPSAAWDDADSERGTLYLYSDGVALYIAVTGTTVWFDQQEREYDGYC